MSFEEEIKKEKERSLLKTENLRDFHSFVWISSMLMFIPVAVSAYRQPAIITIILGLAAFWSVIYHTYSETTFSDIDTIWANITTGVVCLLLNISVLSFGWKNWKFLVPLTISTIGSVIFIVKGHTKQISLMTQKEKEGYEFWHGVWHVLAALAALFLVYPKYDFTTLRYSYMDSFKL